MKLFFRLSFAAIVLTLFAGVFAVTNTNAQGGGNLNEVLRRMEVNRNTMKTLRSNVTMVKYNAQLKEPDTSQGTCIFMPIKEREALIRIDWTKPVAETLAVVEGKYVLYRPRLKQAITGNAKNAKGNGKANNAMAFMNMSKAELKANYNIKYLGEEMVQGGTKTVHLELTPKNTSTYKQADLWVDVNGMPIQAKVIESNNDYTTVLLSDFEKNAKLNLNQFKVKLPNDTKMIDG